MLVHVGSNELPNIPTDVKSASCSTCLYYQYVKEPLKPSVIALKWLTVCLIWSNVHIILDITKISRLFVFIVYHVKYKKNLYYQCLQGFTEGLTHHEALKKIRG